jgi:MFS transporter, ACS family, tartrate transporter
VGSALQNLIFGTHSNLGGFFGPSIVGWAKDLTGSFPGGLYALAAFALMAAVVSALWLHTRAA